ncbi:MAG: OmpH family outer membrane protein [bacterium]|nr:OmpH family outer membrane protein [bacterium]
MNILKKLFITCVMIACAGIAVPAFAATATIDVDQILAEYSKSKIAAAQFRTQEENLQKIVIEAQNKIKAASSPVEKQNIEKTYEARFNAQAERIKTEQMKKLQEIENDIFGAIEKVNNGKYDLILKKSATVYCPNDITDEVLRRLNTK